MQRFLLNNILGAANLGDFAIVNSFVSIINNTVVQGTIQGVSKPTAEDDARAGAVQRAGLRLQAGLGLLLALACWSARRALAAFWKTPRLRDVLPHRRADPAALRHLCGVRRLGERPAPLPHAGQLRRRLLDDEDHPAARPRAASGASTGAFVGFVAAAALILVVAARVMRLPAGGEPFPMRRIASFMGAVVVYTALLNLALNSDLLLLRQFALSAPGVDATAAATVAGNYEALRTFAILPYQALLVVTFVIFPLVSRATFAADREATRAYVSQTMRYALILAGLMGIVLAARPSALFGTIYKPELRRRRGRAADPGRRAVLPGAAVGRLLDPERGRAGRARRCCS